MNDLTKRTFDDCFITPDYIRKKINSDRPFSPVVVDALTFISHSVPRDVIEDCLTFFLDPFDVPLKTGFMGFQRGKMTYIGHSVISYDPSEASLRAGKYYNSGVFYVTLTGHDCAYISAHGQMEQLISQLSLLASMYPLVYSDPVSGEEITAAGLEFKRIDLAKDCFDSRFNCLLSYENCSSVVQSLNNESRWVRTSNFDGFLPGWTLYFGTREKSSCFVRLYDKRVEQGLHKPEAVKELGFDLTDWVRLEFECKKGLPQKIIARLVGSGNFYLELSSIYQELALRYFDLKLKTSVSRQALNKRPTVDFFLQFVAKEEFCAELPDVEYELHEETSKHCSFLLKSSYYKHKTQERVAAFQRQLLRLCRGHSLEELPDIAREALFWESDCDKDKDVIYTLENNVITALNPAQVKALDLFGDMEVDGPVTGTGPILRDIPVYLNEYDLSKLREFNDDIDCF